MENIFTKIFQKILLLIKAQCIKVPKETVSSVLLVYWLEIYQVI